MPLKIKKTDIPTLYLAKALTLLLSAGIVTGCGGAAQMPIDVDEEQNVSFYDHSPLENIPLSQDWTCTSFIYETDIWVRTFYQGGEKFDFRIGPGGVIAELRDTQDSYAALLSPSYKGEPTDRVVQWTWWSNSLVNMNPTLPDYEWRFNVTQAGTFESVIAPTFKVEMNSPGCQIDVYSEPQDQWKSEQSTIMAGGFTARTRYQIAKDGAIIIRRTLLVGQSTFAGQPSPLANEYVEAWTPFSRAKMDAVAFSLTENGSASEWYQAGNNLPSYPFIDVAGTPGYAVSFSAANPNNNAAVGLVYGKAPPCYHQNNTCEQEGSYVLNLMEWDTGVGVLPGLTLPNVMPGDLLDSYIVLQPSHGLDGTLYQNLEYWANKIPAPRLFRANADVGEPLANIMNTLKALQGGSGQRTVHLAPLVE